MITLTPEETDKWWSLITQLLCIQHTTNSTIVAYDIADAAILSLRERQKSNDEPWRDATSNDIDINAGMGEWKKLPKCRARNSETEDWVIADKITQTENLRLLVYDNIVPDAPWITADGRRWKFCQVPR